MSVHQTHASMVTVLISSMVTYVAVSQDMKAHIVMLVGMLFDICAGFLRQDIVSCLVKTLMM